MEQYRLQLICIWLLGRVHYHILYSQLLLGFFSLISFMNFSTFQCQGKLRSSKASEVKYFAYNLKYNPI